MMRLSTLSFWLIGAGLVELGCAAILGDDFKVSATSGEQPGGVDGGTHEAGDAGSPTDTGGDTTDSAGGPSEDGHITIPPDAAPPAVLLSCTTWALPRHVVLDKLAAPPAGTSGNGRPLNRLFVERVGVGNKQVTRVLYDSPASGLGAYSVLTLDDSGNLSKRYDATSRGQFLYAHRTAEGLGLLTMTSSPSPVGGANRLELHVLPNSDSGDGSSLKTVQLAPDNAIQNNFLDGRFVEVDSGNYFYIASAGLDPKGDKNALLIGVSSSSAPPNAPTVVDTGASRFDVGNFPLFDPVKKEVVTVVGTSDGPGPTFLRTFPSDAAKPGTYRSIPNYDKAFALATGREGANYQIAVGQVNDATGKVSVRLAELTNSTLDTPNLDWLATYPADGKGISIGDVPIQGGSQGWANNEFFMIGGNPIGTTPGLNFLYLDANGGVRASQAGPTKILPDRTVIASGIDMNQRIISSFVGFDVAWVEVNSDQSGTLYYDRLVCIGN